MPGNEGLLFSHTVGKTLGNGRCNTFAVKRLKEVSLCPVQGLDDYVKGAKDIGVDLRTGCLFRLLDTSKQSVLEHSLTYAAIYDRLKYYLNTLGINEGETPHSLRRGCAITLSLSGEGGKAEEIMGHVGWFSEKSLKRYNNLDKILDSSSISNMFASVGDCASDPSDLYDRLGTVGNMLCAWDITCECIQVLLRM